MSHVLRSRLALTMTVVGIAIALLVAFFLQSVNVFGANAEAPPAQGDTISVQASSPYSITEFAVNVAEINEYAPLVSASWAVWQRGSTELAARNLQSTDVVTLPVAYNSAGMDLDGEVLVLVEETPDTKQKGVFGYRLSDKSRFTIAAPMGDAQFFRVDPRISGDYVVWVQGSNGSADIFGHNLATGQMFPIATGAARQEYPSISGNIVVWADTRNSSGTGEYDLYGYDLEASREFRITARPATISYPAVSGTTVVWSQVVDGKVQIVAHNLANSQARVLADLGSEGPRGLDIDGNLVVWGALGRNDGDVFGYDLAKQQRFVVSRAIGEQSIPRIAGQTVVWLDARHSGVGKYEYQGDIYGAKLEAGSSATEPPIIGDPGAADARIEIVWPHGGASVADADRANIAAWLFQPGTMNLAACQWNPRVQLWRAVNSVPAQMVASGMKVPRYDVLARAIPDWQFNDVDVSTARQADNRVYFWVTIEGTPSRSNVWAHAADARTFFPQQDTPTGTTTITDTVSAKIEIVWPHGNATVANAQRANVSAMLFAPGTLQSAPTNWEPTVRLLRAQNNGVLEPVAVGQRRLVTAGALTYPVWDFNDVDVAAARDPQNKLYFVVSVDGVQTQPNVWVHGVDARTYFPQMDVPTSPCP